MVTVEKNVPVVLFVNIFFIFFKIHNEAFVSAGVLQEDRLWRGGTGCFLDGRDWTMRPGW